MVILLKKRFKKYIMYTNYTLIIYNSYVVKKISMKTFTLFSNTDAHS